jgi:predicted  nucleic acid-binding Zn-ribbon protein
MNEDLAKLTAIAVLDRRLQALDASIKKHQKRLDDSKQRVQKVETDLQSKREALTALKNEERSLQRKLHLYRDRRNSAIRILESGVGDFTAAERQVAQCDDILDNTETLLLEALETHDALDEDIEQREAALVDAQAGLTVVTAESTSTIDACNAEWREIVAKREVDWATLEREFHHKYENLLRRKKYAVAPIYQGACHGCQRVIQRQEAADVKRGLLMTCRGCHRWLVLEEEWPLPLGL